MSVIQQSADTSLLTDADLKQVSGGSLFIFDWLGEAVVIGVTAAIVYTEMTGKLNEGLHR
jgi:hypothetical protein